AQPVPSLSEPHVVVESVEGLVEAAPSGTDNWSPARPNQLLRTGDQLRTGDKSRATLRTSTRGIVRVRERSLLVVREPRTNDRPIMDLLRGFFYFFNRDTSVEVEIQTRLASAVTRGTEFHAFVREDGYFELTVVDGEVQVSNPQGQSSAVSNQQV